MKSLQRVLCLGIGVFILYGCASPVVVQKYDKPEVKENESAIIFYRSEGIDSNIASVWVEDRIVGSLLPNRYAQTVTCAGNRQIRIDSRYGSVVRGSEQLFNAPKGQTSYVKIVDAATADQFTLVQVDSATAQADLDKLGKSHTINRHYASCDTIYTDLSADTLFDFNKSTLKPEGVSVINGFAAKLLEQKAMPVTNIRIEGFTDRLGSTAYNEKLSLARAQTVASQLKSQNIRAQIDAVGMGERFPVSQGCVGEKATAELLQCLAPDRRVRIATKVAVEQTRIK